MIQIKISSLLINVSHLLLLKKDIEEGHIPTDSQINFTITKHSVFVETDVIEERFLEEEKVIEQLLCGICESTLKSTDNLKNHNERLRIMQGTDTISKCDFFNYKFADKGRLCDPFTNTHKNCSLCVKIFPTAEFLDPHENSVHIKGKTKRLKITLV